MKTTLTIEIDYAPSVTDPVALAAACDRLLKTALSTPGILDEYGNPSFGEFLVLSSKVSPADRDRAIEALLAKAEIAVLQPDDLDEIVHELASSIAADINNEGMERQLGYLIEQMGVQGATEQIDQLVETRSAYDSESASQ